MLKPIISCIFALVGYALLNILIERYLSKSSTSANNLLFGLLLTAAAFPIAFIQYNFNQKFVLPPLNNYWLLVGIGLTILIGDYFYLKAYHLGGSLALVCTMVAMFPVVAAMVNTAFGAPAPTARQVVGMLLAIVAVALVTTGEPPKDSPEKLDTTVETSYHDPTWSEV